MNPSTWQLQDAKNRFSQLVQEALEHGPQLVTRRGRNAVVVIAAETYERLTRPAGSLVEFFRNSPLAEANLEVTRDPDSGREVTL